MVTLLPPFSTASAIFRIPCWAEIRRTERATLRRSAPNSLVTEDFFPFSPSPAPGRSSPSPSPATEIVQENGTSPLPFFGCPHRDGENL